MTFELYNAYQTSNVNIVPSETDSRNSDVSDEINYIKEIHSIEQDRQDISECFQSVAISRLKVHAQPLSGRANLGKRKLNTVISTIQEKVASALNITSKEINLDTSATEGVDLLRIKRKIFDRLMHLIKEKLSTIKIYKEIIQVLPHLSSRNLVSQKSGTFL